MKILPTFAASWPNILVNLYFMINFEILKTQNVYWFFSGRLKGTDRDDPE